MELQIVLAILGVASVMSAFLFALKGLLDQIPEVIRSWRRVVDEARRARIDPEPAPEEGDGGPGQYTSRT
ncbi:hypothetical protein QNN03_25240 [Streptomyces sp. GXMU-J15]|uniref:Sec-independent protein translocase TatA n=1 Tax=Streptomyces fuscus TaxID=3048495 RepID=A0ABT7J602_9ACTN|nr:MULTISPECIES: hypothetical protein [Streptomyces]MDL2079752.1 hypothetical protein [Streptomyces fuscus]SBT90274.1 hypothetical protein GA0115233_101711 [Streptomyces sp. DI166]